MQIHTIHQSITCFLIQSEYVREMILVNKVGCHLAFQKINLGEKYLKIFTKMK